MEVELIFDSDCPNVELARANLAEALKAARREPRWREWNKSAPDAPAHARRFGSPTILINGVDVSGELAADADCCRLYRSRDGRFLRAPSREAILSALMHAPAERSDALPAKTGTPGSGVGAMLSGGAALAALLPSVTCPACWPAYAALLTSLGLPFVAYSAELPWVAASLVAVAVGATGLSALRRGGYGALGLAIVAGVAMLSGRFLIDSPPATYLGAAALVTASMWNALAGRVEFGALRWLSISRNVASHRRQ
jgi:hypothetical protein